MIDNSNENIEKNIPEKGPLNFIVGSLTSFLLFIFFYFLSNKIAIYFSVHKPSNSSEIVQNISSSINTLIIGLSFLLTFSFAFIGIGLFIVFIRSFIVTDNSNENIEKNIPEKGPLNFIVGSLTSFLFFIFFYFLSNKIAIYFSIHKPSNSSEIVQNISSSINTLIIGLSFLLTFSFAFIGIGLFIVFIRSFFLKKS